MICVLAQNTTLDKITKAHFEKKIEEGKFSKVETELFKYVVANPKDAIGFFLLAKLRLKQNRLNEAKSLSQKTLTLDPHLLSAKLILAEVYIQMGETEQARAVLNDISEREISESSIRLNIAQTFALAGDCSGALKAVDKLPSRVKNNEALPIRAACFFESDDEKSFASLVPFAKTAAKQNPQVAIKFAEVMSKGSHHREAADLLRLVIFSSPKNTTALLLLAKSEIYLKDLLNAKIHLTQVERLQPDSSELLFVKSVLESEQGNNARSLELLEKSIAANPDNIEVLAQFVVSAMRANQAGKAVQAAKKLIDLKPDNLEFLYLYGAASLQNNNLQKAETSLTKYVESRPNDSRGCLALGLTLAAQTDKLSETRQQFLHCLGINPNNYEAAYQLGLSYKTQGESAKAIEYLEQTVQLSPNYALGLRDLGAVYIQTGAEARARPVLEKATLLNPNDADTHFQLSRLYNIIGEHELGKKHLQIFQKLKNPTKNGM